MNESKMCLGRDWQGENIDGWLLSEKFDGCRAYWDGSKLWTRGGNIINAPEWFIRGLPASHLDCEIWAGYGNLTVARLATQYGIFTPECKLVIHDCPSTTGSWLRRIRIAEMLTAGLPQVECVSPMVCKNEDHAIDLLQEVLARNGEGLVARNPSEKQYQSGRSRNLLKIKDASLVYERMSVEMEVC